MYIHSYVMWITDLKIQQRIVDPGLELLPGLYRMCSLHFHLVLGLKSESSRNVVVKVFYDEYSTASLPLI